MNTHFRNFYILVPAPDKTNQFIRTYVLLDSYKSSKRYYKDNIENKQYNGDLT